MNELVGLMNEYVSIADKDSLSVRVLMTFIAERERRVRRELERQIEATMRSRTSHPGCNVSHEPYRLNGSSSHMHRSVLGASATDGHAIGSVKHDIQHRPTDSPHRFCP